VEGEDFGGPAVTTWMRCEAESGWGMNLDLNDGGVYADMIELGKIQDDDIT
jgi:hypothetical protein